MAIDKSYQVGLDFGVDNEAQIKVALSGLRAWTPQQWALASDWQALVGDFLASKTGQNLAEFMA